MAIAQELPVYKASYDLLSAPKPRPPRPGLSRPADVSPTDFLRPLPDYPHVEIDAKPGVEWEDFRKQ